MDKTFNVLKLFILVSIIFYVGDNNILYSTQNVSNNNLNKQMSLQDIAKGQKEIVNQLKIEEQKKLFTPKSTFLGTLTGYSADCVGCSGNLACTGTNAKTNGVYYNDKTYGNVRIVATSSKYPCGTVLKFDLPNLSNEPTIAIALDTGVSNNTVDLLMENSNAALKYVGRINNKKFEVLRLGW